MLQGQTGAEVLVLLIRSSNLSLIYGSLLLENSCWCIDFIHINGKTNGKQLDVKKGHSCTSVVPAFSVIVMMKNRSKSMFLHALFTSIQNYTFCDIKSLICFILWESTKRNLFCTKQNS